VDNFYLSVRISSSPSPIKTEKLVYSLFEDIDNILLSFYLEKIFSINNFEKIKYYLLYF